MRSFFTLLKLLAEAGIDDDLTAMHHRAYELAKEANNADSAAIRTLAPLIDRLVVEYVRERRVQTARTP